MRLALAQINPTIGDFAGNKAKIVQALDRAKRERVDLLLFSELTITGYPPEDFLLHKDFVEKAQKTLEEILPFTKGVAAVIGLPRANTQNLEKGLFNSAAILSDGKLLGYQDKCLLPTYDVFDERRYFEPGSEYTLFDIAGKKVAITICEDIWQHAGKAIYTTYRKDPVEMIAPLKPDLLLNLSASPYNTSKYDVRLEVVKSAAKTLKCPIALCNQVGGNDSLLFDGYSVVVNENGDVVEKLKGFEEDFKIIEHFTPQKTPIQDSIADLHSALVMGIRDYFHKSGFKKACLGLSGGIDSAVVACLAVEALGSENVLGVALPSRYSSESSLTDAKALAENLHINLKTISIEEPFKAYLTILEPHFANFQPDLTEENLQSRIRGMILMALSNKMGYIVLSTGNKSEMAMGYTTLYGDLTGGLSVISDVVKEKVYDLARYINKDSQIIPESTLTKAPSAELRPNQKDSDSLPPYDIIDKVLEGYVERHETAEEISKKHHIDLALVNTLIDKIHRSEYKRRQAPPGLRVTEKAFSVGRRFPIVQKFR